MANTPVAIAAGAFAFWRGYPLRFYDRACGLWG